LTPSSDANSKILVKNNDTRCNDHPLIPDAVNMTEAIAASN